MVVVGRDEICKKIINDGDDDDDPVSKGNPSSASLIANNSVNRKLNHYK